MALWSDWKFTLLVVAGASLTNFIFKFLYKRTKYFSRKFTGETHIFQNLLVQKVHSFKYLKATGLNKIYGDKLKKNIRSMENLQKRIGLVDAILTSLREPLTILVVFAAVFINLYFFNEVLAGILFSLVLLYRSITYFMAMQEQWNTFLGVSGTLENMKAFKKELSFGKEKNGSKSFEGFKKEMRLQNLTFEFEPGNPIIKSINLTIRRNETIAIVGESGSGKTTLMNLISGLLFPSSGKYEIDGIPIEDLEQESFKQRIGYIVQDATIFNDTIFNNISFWAPKTEENYQRFIHAVKRAAIFDFIQKLPGKEDTVLGTNGINISGGQRQRLSIARELFKKVDFLFMDEATSALDGETESVIQQNIHQLKGEFTILIIAHRLSTIKNADRIILMKDGSVIDIGNFKSLLSSSVEFREMVRLQNI